MFQISHCCTCHSTVPCDSINLHVCSYVSLQVFHESEYLTLLQSLIQKALLHFLPHSNSTTISNVIDQAFLAVFSNHVVYCTGFTSEVIACADQDDFSRDHVIKWFTDIKYAIISDITAGQKNWCFVEIGICTLHIPAYSKPSSQCNIPVHCTHCTYVAVMLAFLNIIFVYYTTIMCYVLTPCDVIV